MSKFVFRYVTAENKSEAGGAMIVVVLTEKYTGLTTKIFDLF